mgnify:CR=1 FL=1
MKGKLVEAILYGTASVTSYIGAEGIEKDVWNGLICNDFGTLGENLKTLYTDKTTYMKAQQEGYRIIKEKFSHEKFAKDWIEKIVIIQANLKQNRQDNFLGEILHHNSLQSTKYLAKWIEEKGK